ncbi:ShlB/FhaC/HecB family hemolysin secretion/activation protein [Pseudooceanicola sp. MF1-13]|uniref:ShlB/FhaC/HecB family hemolysin secretion/activation protein n=1 Tax=Pseudooceanicola sp. MF1-13 TaxID=3379095 RepID=UPI0038916646
MNLRQAAIATAVAGMLAGSAVAQTAPTPGAVLQQTTSAPEAPVAPSSQIVLPGPSETEKTGSTFPIPVRKLEISGNSLIDTDALHALVAADEGRTLTLDQLFEVVARITAAYRAAGYPVAYAYLPAQIVENGVIRIEVIEPVYDQIQVTGTSRFKAEQARATVGVASGEPVAEEPLHRGLLLLQETPGVIVNGVLLPGATPGTTSLRLERSDQPLLSGQATLDNYGNTYTGQVMANTAVTLANPFGWGSAFSLNTTLSQGGGLKALAFNASSPDLGNGLRLGAYASTTRYKLGGAFAALDQVGWARQLGAQLSYPVVLSPGKRLTLRLDLVDTKMGQNTRSTGAEERQHVQLMRLEMSGARIGDNGAVTSGRIALNFGKLTLGPAAARAADAAGPRAAGSFATLRFQLDHSRPIAEGVALNLGISGQLANKNLDSSQKFYLGGPNGLMSTAVGAGGGDNGVLVKVGLSRTLTTNLPGQLTLSGQLQWGAVRVDHTSYAGGATPNTLSGSAAVLGLRYQKDRWFINAAAAAPISDRGLQSAGRLWLSAGVTF